MNSKDNENEEINSNYSESDSDSDSDIEFEDQGSSDDDENIPKDSDDSDNEEDKEEEELIKNMENSTRKWSVGKNRYLEMKQASNTSTGQLEKHLHVDDLSSDDEEDENNNTIGRVPLHWYDAYDHIGYNISGEKIIKPQAKDSIDNAIANKDDPNASHTIYDMYNARYVTLSERDLEIIRRIQSGAIAHPEHNDTPDYIDYYSSIIEEMPIMAAPEPKRRFITSKWEMMKIMKIVKAIKEGRYIFPDEKLKQKKLKESSVYMIWNDTEDEVISDSKRNRYHLPAPKAPLPGHAESYNPPSEYLLNQEEIDKMNDLPPEQREYNFTPAKYSCLRHVPGYDNFIKERFERCLDLYLCPRKLKRRLNINPETLVPKLPKPKELKPFPNTLSLQYLGHTKNVRCITISPDGQYFMSASDDGTVRLWEIDTSLCREIWKFPEPVTYISWNPNPQNPVVALVTGNKVILLATGTGDKDSHDILDSFLSSVEFNQNNNEENKNESDDDDNESDDSDDEDKEGDEDDDNKANKIPQSKKSKENIKWQGISSNDDNNNLNAKKRDHSSSTTTSSSSSIKYRTGPRAELICHHAITQIVWHYRGDYLGVVSPDSGSHAISIHQISKGTTQFPFRRKSPGKVEIIQFHPSRPCLFVATQQHVRIYHLVEQKLIKKLLSGSKWISSMDIHHSGDHVLLGSYDRRVIWFDLDLSSTPYKTLKYHEKAIRDVKYHPKYPLMASASDDGTIHIFHATVYSDLLKNPLIVPLKVLRGHGVKGGIGVHSIAFHPKQPWILSAGADGLINLYQDIF